MKDEGDYPEDDKKVPMDEKKEKKEKDGKHEKRKVEEKKHELASKIKGKKNGADDFSRSDRKKEKKLSEKQA